MAKRRISQQQSRRISAAQGKKLENAGDLSGELSEGLVIARYGKRALVEDASSGEQRQCFIRPHIDNLVAGDRVAWQASENEGVIEALEDRSSVLTRTSARGDLKPIAANVDLMLIVIAVIPKPHANLIDRYLVAAEHAGIRPALVINKGDLHADEEEIRRLARVYEDLGYAVTHTDRESDPEARRLHPLMAGQTAVLVGQSGVGKSSLVKRLLPVADSRSDDIRVGALSEGADKGRHTTTAAELYHLPTGGKLIDSPGIREFQLAHLPAEEVASAFIEFRPFLGQCRFRDCRHVHETDCALLAAVDQGAVSRERFDSFRLITDQQG